MMPRVSVVMAVYNNAKHLLQAIDSILEQTFTDFEFVILDDGSSDSSPELLARYPERDRRVSVHRADRNQGLSTALNLGLRHARGRYIARMDADDISLPERLKQQVDFMDAHPEIGICGTWVELIGDIQGQIRRYPSSHDAIVSQLLFTNALVHPSVLMRADLLRQYDLHYAEGARYAQDYELWSRAIAKIRFANIEKALLKYRIHAQAAGVLHRKQQYEMLGTVHRRMLAHLYPDYGPEEFALHQRIATYDYGPNPGFVGRARSWLESLSRANRRSGLLIPATLDSELGVRWTQVCYGSRAPALYRTFHILASDLPFRGHTGPLKILRALLFCARRILPSKSH